MPLVMKKKEIKTYCSSKALKKTVIFKLEVVSGKILKHKLLIRNSNKNNDCTLEVFKI